MMNIENVAFSTVDWALSVPVEYKGRTGTSFWRTTEVGNIRLRMVEYSAGYGTDHWCSRGHVLLVLTGELQVELRDGRKIVMSPGMSFCVSTDAQNPHFVSAEVPTKVFIVD